MYFEPGAVAGVVVLNVQDILVDYNLAMEGGEDVVLDENIIDTVLGELQLDVFLGFPAELNAVALLDLEAETGLVDVFHEHSLLLLHQYLVVFVVLQVAHLYQTIADLHQTVVLKLFPSLNLHVTPVLAPVVIQYI